MNFVKCMINRFVLMGGLVSMNAILSADLSWCIGNDGGLLFHVPEDMKFFKNTTMGHTVVMGRLTFESLPGKNPLPGRRNIILSSSVKNIAGAETAANTSELMGLISSDMDNVFVMGGANVYNQLLKYCKRAYVTRFLAQGNGDVFFPNLDKNPAWQLEYESGLHYFNGLEFKFTTYKNLSPALFV